ASTGRSSPTARPRWCATPRFCAPPTGATSSRSTAVMRSCWTIRTTGVRAPGSVLDLLLQPLTLGFMQRALLASALVGALTALVGGYVVVKGLAFTGDAVWHAA